jgi:hypothetical protein
VDLARVEKVEVTEKHIRKPTHLDMAASRSNSRVKVAVVTSDPDGQFLSDSYDKYADGKSPWVTKAFTTLEAAEAWVGVPPLGGHV